MANILVVDDENAMLQLIKRILEKDAHTVTLQANAKAVLDIDFRRYDLILLDIMMPDMDGFELCNQIRSLVDCPIIFLTAKTQESDIVRGLGIGGDDYITKPFGTNELLARVNAHLRRDNREKKYAISISGIIFHINAKETEVNGNKLPLTKSEYEICEYLALHRGQVFSKEQIYEAVFGFEGESDDSVIATHVKNIRSKLAAVKLSPIETVWGWVINGSKKLRSIFMRYIFTVAGGILFIIAINVGLYMFCINTEVIIPVMNIEDRIADAAEEIQTSKFFDTADIPNFCDYGVYTPAGVFQYGSLSEDTANTFWEEATTNGKNIIPPYRVRVIERVDDVVLLRYRLTSQFNNTTLRRICPASDLLLVGLIIIEIVVLLFLVSHWFGKYTGRKIDKLLIVTQKIEKQDLDFKIESSGIFEVDRALSALEHLKQALKNSLAEQWQADKLRQEQISALAHDLKTPLTIIRGNTELLYDTILADNQKECADYIEGSVVQMQDYIETLIDMTKAKENFPFHRKNVKLSSLLQEIRTQAKGLCAVKNIYLEWRENVDREYIFADSEQLMRVFANVFSNAIEYTPAGKTVFFEVYEKDNSILCSITDMGSGFSPEALKHATEQFYMDEQSRHSKSHYGIGLYVADSIIAKHGGQLILSNSEKTGGAQVIIKIPY